MIDLEGSLRGKMTQRVIGDRRQMDNCVKAAELLYHNIANIASRSRRVPRFRAKCTALEQKHVEAAHVMTSV
jgi:hypothetical protein